MMFTTGKPFHARLGRDSAAVTRGLAFCRGGERIGCAWQERSWPTLRAFGGLLASTQCQAKCRCELGQSVVRDAVGDGSDSEGEGEAWIVEEVITPYNEIRVIEVDANAEHELAGAWVLKLDDEDLAHSVYWNDGRKLTGAYYDELASLPPLIPEGPVGIFGLGGGTEARILLHHWPDLVVQGWEIDAEVVRVGRRYFGLSKLEMSGRRGKNERAGRGHLVVHVGDVFQDSARVSGGFAGLFVDLYSKGRICEALTKQETWRELRGRLREGGRVLVNCGGPPVDGESEEWRKQMIATSTAMAGAFEQDICVKQVLDDSRNVLLLTGNVPDFSWWSSKLPAPLSTSVSQWKVWSTYCMG